MAAFYKDKPLYTKVWKRLKTGITGTDSVRACINNGKENYSIDVSFYKPGDHLADGAVKQKEAAQIEIELPKGGIWTGTITELQSILSPHCKY